MHPLEAFKQARQQAVFQSTAEQRQRRHDLLDAFTSQLSAEVGAEVLQHLAVDLATETPPTFRIRAKDHIPVMATSDPLRFTVTRRGDRRVFEHLADALTFGEPYPLPKGGKTVEASFDTTKKDA